MLLDGDYVPPLRLGEKYHSYVQVKSELHILIHVGSRSGVTQSH